MKIYIMTEDLGDGDVGLRFFKSEEDTQDYYNQQESKGDYSSCWHESNPHCLDLDKILSGEFLYDL